MKSILLLPALILFVLTCAFTLDDPPVSIDVFTALEKKMISLDAKSEGLNSENCAKLTIRNLTSDKLQLTIPAGTLLNTNTDSEQDILMTKPAQIFVENHATSSTPAYGFCCQASNGVPEKGGTFAVQKCMNPELVKLAEYLSANEFEPLLQQGAIWAVSDKHSVGGIYGDNRVQCKKLREFTAGLLKQPVPFYDVDYGYQLNEEYNYNPKTLQGNLQYRLNSPGKATLAIYRPDGNLYHIFYSDKYLDWGYYTQNFRFTATGMESGEYQVKLTIDGEVISKQSIII